MKALTFRATLRTQLETAGQAAIEMLKGDREPDAVILLAALEAASLLDDVTVGDAARDLRTTVLSAARGSDLLPWLTGTALDLAPESLPDDDLAREAAVHRWVTLAAIAPLLPDGAARRVHGLLDDLRGRLLANPEAFADLAPVAEWMLDQLDLDLSHPAVALLEDLAETGQIAPVADAQVAGAFAAARTRLDALQTSPLADWGRRLAGAIGEWLGGLTQEPVLAAAADDDAPGPRPRHLVWTGPDGHELCLLVSGGRLIVEMLPAQDIAPALGGDPLEELVSALDGARCWSLPARPPAGPLILEFTLQGQALRVEVGRGS